MLFLCTGTCMCLRHAHTYESYLLFCLMGGKLFRLYKNCNMESNFFFLEESCQRITVCCAVLCKHFALRQKYWNYCNTRLAFLKIKLNLKFECTKILPVALSIRILSRS